MNCARCGATDTKLMRAVWPPGAPATCLTRSDCEERAEINVDRLPLTAAAIVDLGTHPDDCGTCGLALAWVADPEVSDSRVRSC